MAARRTDGSSLVQAWAHYFVKPWVDPVGFWSNELKHLAYIAMDPVGHELGHQRAVINALRDGRPIDAVVARFNDMWEPADQLSPVARRLFPQHETRRVKK